VDSGAMQIGNLTAFLQYVMQILMSVMMATIMFVMVPRAAASAERIASSAATCPITGAQSITYWWILSAASQRAFGAQRYPMRQPVIAYVLLVALMVITLSPYNAGLTCSTP
jgi:ABC-type multidrug transport system fused ATPase/permease subunit